MSDLLKALAVTAEVVGTDWSEAAAEYIANELKAYSLADVQVALRACTKEFRGKRLTLGEILDRLPSGHPDPEEAWSKISQCMNNEQISIVWTDEMRQAYGAAAALAYDKVAARMAFKEVYAKLVNEARTSGKQPSWSVSLGFDPALRQEVIEQAVKLNQISAAHAARLMPPSEPLHDSVQHLVASVRSINIEDRPMARMHWEKL